MDGMALGFYKEENKEKRIYLIPNFTWSKDIMCHGQTKVKDSTVSQGLAPISMDEVFNFVRERNSVGS